VTTDITTEQRIARAALNILEKQGPEAVSMRRIAEEVGITPMAIYHYFPNREELLHSIVTKEFSELLSFIQRAPASSSMEKHFVHIMDAYMDYAFARPHIFDYIFSKPRPGARRFPEDFRERRSPTLNPLADEVAKSMEKGQLRQDDVWEVAFGLWAHAHGYVTLYRAGRINLSRDEFKKLVNRSLRRMLHGLKA
jgi:AcrR family transcriptional regulator